MRDEYKEMKARIAATIDRIERLQKIVVRLDDLKREAVSMVADYVATKKEPDVRRQQELRKEIAICRAEIAAIKAEANA